MGCAAPTHPTVMMSFAGSRRVTTPESIKSQAQKQSQAPESGSITRNRGDGVSPPTVFPHCRPDKGGKNGWTNRRLLSPDCRFVISPSSPGLTAARSDSAPIEGSTVPWGATPESYQY